MPQQDAWKLWGRRLRVHLSERGENLGKLAERMIDPDSGRVRAESTLRSWTNRNREINLSEFFELCKQAKADPAQILFGQPIMSEEVRKQIGALASSVTEADSAANSDDPKPSRHQKRRAEAVTEWKKRRQ